MSKNQIFSSIILFITLVSCNNLNQEIIFHNSHEPTRVNVPFSDAVETNDLLFLTGQIGKNHSLGKLVEGGIEAETKQVIKNIEDVLNHHDLSLDNVVKCTVILNDINDINDFKAFNSVYIKYFTKNPASTTFAASELVGGTSIEIGVIAAK